MGYAIAIALFGALLYLNLKRLRRGMRDAEDRFGATGGDPSEPDARS